MRAREKAETCECPDRAGNAGGKERSEVSGKDTRDQEI